MKNPLVGIVMHPDGRILCTDPEAGHILAFTPSLQYLHIFSGSEIPFNWPVGIAANADGDVFVVE